MAEASWTFLAIVALTVVAISEQGDAAATEATPELLKLKVTWMHYFVL
jgi:hypothetical protein